MRVTSVSGLFVPAAALAFCTHPFPAAAGQGSLLQVRDLPAMNQVFDWMENYVRTNGERPAGGR